MTCSLTHHTEQRTIWTYDQVVRAIREHGHDDNEADLFFLTNPPDTYGTMRDGVSGWLASDVLSWLGY